MLENSVLGFDPLEAFERMYLIRSVEEEISQRYSEEKMRCPTHLSIGQESVAVGVAMALSPGDQVYSNHRCHAHYLAMGGDLGGLIAELYGKETGCAGGWGGSMHLVDEAKGMMGTSAIVGSSISVALGAAWALKLKGSSNRVVSFFGDSGPETGQLYECINLAVLHSLPIIFVCEDNGYSTQTPLEKRRPDIPFASVARAMGLFAWEASNQRPDTIFYLMQRARTLVPSLLYVKTYRFREHVGPNYDYELGYRSAEEVFNQMDEDPLITLQQELLGDTEERNHIRLHEIRLEVEGQITSAFDFAESSPWPRINWY